MEMNEIIGFVEAAKKGSAKKEDLMEYRDKLEREKEKINGEIADTKAAIAKCAVNNEETPGSTRMSGDEGYGVTDADLQAKNKELENRRSQISHYLNTLEELLDNYRNFDKSVCFSNIRELLRQNPDVKIGQIEREAGIRLGYMSRLEKEGNKAEPSMEFIVSAAKLLKVSLDALVSINLTGLTPTEQYLMKFFDKLKADTLADKLEWHVETLDYFNKQKFKLYGNKKHPLFGLATFLLEKEGGNSKSVERVVFSSHSFGLKTLIHGDCFNLRLKNGTTLYLMDIEKNVQGTNDPEAFAVEIWSSTPGNGRQFLVSSKSETPIAPLVDTLFSTVKERMQHPRLNKTVMCAIDAFMKDDWEDDPIPVDIPTP